MIYVPCVPRPLVPTSPTPVPTNPHKVLANNATAEVPCVSSSWRLTQGRIISNHSAPVYAGITGNVKVHLAFSSVYSMTNDGESRAGQAQSTDSNFALGENVVYVDGERGVETVVYEGAAPTGT